MNLFKVFLDISSLCLSIISIKKRYLPIDIYLSFFANVLSLDLKTRHLRLLF